MRLGLKLATRILLLALSNLLLIALAFSLFLRLQLQEGFGYFLMSAGREKARLIAQQVAMQLPDLDQPKLDRLLESYSRANGIILMVYDSLGNRLAGRDLLPPAEVEPRLRPKLGSLVGKTAQNTWIPPFIQIAKGPVPYWMGLWLPAPRVQKAPRRQMLMLVLASPTLVTNPFFFELRPWLEIAGIALAITILCWLPMISALTRAINQMMSATARIAEGQFDVVVSADRKDELGHLGASINRMTARLDMYTRGRNRFLGDVAHELRSPLGRMQAALGILERNQFLASAQQEHPMPSHACESAVADLLEEVELMSGLTEELLTFARSKLVPEALQLVPTNLAVLVSRVIRAERTAGTNIRAQIDPSLYVKAEPEYLFRSVANAVRNAVRYAGLHGDVRVTAEARADVVVLSISDDGPGIAEEALEHIFTPFYRLDPSRDRRSGGTGLGLSIVRGCIEACQGSVACRNRIPTGLEVTITLQAAQPVSPGQAASMGVPA